MSTLKGYSLKLAEIEDLESWMKLVTSVRDNFPLLEIDAELENYKNVVIKNINRNSAICAKDDNDVIGVLIFSYNQKCLSCMAVDPKHRRYGIATDMIQKMLSLLPIDENVSVITFRAEDDKGTAPRALYKKLGFKEEELLIEHNYPHQRFVLYRK